MLHLLPVKGPVKIFKEVMQKPVQSKLVASSLVGLTPLSTKVAVSVADCYSRFGVFPSIEEMYPKYGLNFHHVEKALPILIKAGLVTTDPPLRKWKLQGAHKIIPTKKLVVAEKKESRPAGATYIYLMVDNRNGTTKIGESSVVGQRQRTLQSEVPQVELLFCWPGTKTMEKQLHEKYKGKRVAKQPGRRKKAEYFHLTEQDRNDIISWMKEQKPRGHE